MTHYNDGIPQTHRHDIEYSSPGAWQPVRVAGCDALAGLVWSADHEQWVGCVTYMPSVPADLVWAPV